ncbi:MAG: allantoicase [Polyangiaceae bacterium]
MSQDAASATFTGLVDLASAALGGHALACSDDFFAGMDNLIAPGHAIFIPGKYTERGKWMDGWESRRKRVPGHDWCVLRLGVVGDVIAFDIDTSHFVGNHPAFASVDGWLADAESTSEQLLEQPCRELLGQSPLLPGSQNLFVVPVSGGAVSHLRLNIFPDGGVARLRAYGRVSARWKAPALDAASREHVAAGHFDLCALENGAVALACSDAHFGGMNNLLLPGRAVNMGSGWETRRRRGAGHDWIVIRLAGRGTPGVIEVDTNHFKGNYPDRCAIDGIDAANALPTELVASEHWRPLLGETKLSADTRHFFSSELLERTPITHVRLRIFPDGGVSRLRLWGTRDE